MHACWVRHSWPGLSKISPGLSNCRIFFWKDRNLSNTTRWTRRSRWKVLLKRRLLLRIYRRWCTDFHKSCTRPSRNSHRKGGWQRGRRSWEICSISKSSKVLFLSQLFDVNLLQLLVLIRLASDPSLSIPQPHMNHHLKLVIDNSSDLNSWLSW